MRTKKEKSFTLVPAIPIANELSNKHQRLMLVRDTLYVFLTASAVLMSMLIAADKIGLFEVNREMFNWAVLIPAFFACAYVLIPYKWLVLLVSHMGILIFVWKDWQRLFDGAVLLVREMILLVNTFYGTYYRYPIVLNEFKLSSYYSAIVLLLILLLSSLLCFLLSKGNGVILCGLSLLGVFFVSTNLTYTAIYLPILLGLLAFLSAFSLYASALSKKERKNRFVIFSSRSEFANGVIAVLLVASLSIGAIFVAVPKAEQVHEAPLAKIATDPNAIYELLPLIKSFNPFNLSAFKWGAGVGDGRLNAGLRSTGTGKTDLMVFASSTDKESVLPYLKGYVGSNYNSEKMKWEDLPDSVYSDYGSLFNDMSARQITMQSFAKSYMKLTSMHDIASKSSKVFVKNIDANKKYSYFPYNSTTDYYNSSQFNGIDFYRDTYIKGKDVDDSDYYFDTVRLYDYRIATAVSALLPQTFKIYEDYSAFAVENYLQLPQNGVERIKATGLEMKENILAGKEKSDNSDISTMAEGDRNLIDLGNSTDSGAVDINVSTAIFSVKQYLKDHAVYDLACGETPAGKDFAEYFLYESNRGYCVHFATAGTLLFRAMGIPARYVEGYIMTEDESNTSGSWKEIPDSNAHAWVEIFTDVSGWQPVEVTPGFSTVAIAPPSQNVEVPPEITNNVSSELASAPALPSAPEISSDIPSDLSSDLSSDIPSDTASSDIFSSGGTSSVSNVGSTESDGTDGEENKAQKPMSLGMRTTLFVVLAFCIAAAALWLAGCLARRKRDKRFSDKDGNIAYRYVYDYLLRLLNFVGIKRAGDEDDNAFAIRAQQELFEAFSVDCSDNKLLNITKNALFAKFSNKTLDRSEVLEAVDFYYSIASRIYEKISIPKRLGFIIVKLIK